MIKQTTYSKNYRQQGLSISIKDDKMIVTQGKLVYDREYQLDKDVAFNLVDETVIILLVEDLATGEILVAESDGSIDKSQYRLIERLAWKTEQGWQSLEIKPFPETPKARGYNYGNLGQEAIKKALTVQEKYRKTIGPDGKVKTENIKRTISKRKS